MKVSDLNQILTEATSQLTEKEWSILEYVDLRTAAIMVLNIYLTNDILNGFGQDVGGAISVISSTYRIATIANRHHSYYKSELAICDYEELDVDIHEILFCIQTSIDRMEALM